MLELQRKLLGDRIRNAAFHKALKSAISPSKSILLDVGSGTGFLSFLAEKLGAKECWLVENGDVGVLAERLATMNGMKACRFVHAHSNDVPLPKADVIVSEILGNYALEEGIIDTMNGARKYLKKGGVLIPSSVRQFACPVTSPRLQKEIDVWKVGYDIDMSAARSISLQNMYVKTVKKTDLLDAGKAACVWDNVDFTVENENVREGTMEWKIAKKTTVHGIAVWWESTLSRGVKLSTSPLSKPTHWGQIYLPLLYPVTCAPDETLHVQLRSDTSPEVRIRLRWTTKVLRRSELRSSQESDTFEGLM